MIPFLLPRSLVPLLAATLAALSPLQADDSQLQELALKAAANPAELAAFLKAAGQNSTLGPEEKLAALWQATLIATEPEQKREILAQASTIALPETWMLVAYYQYDPSMATEVAMANKALKALLPAPKSEKPDTPAPPAERNVMNTPSLHESWEDPLGFTARWTAEGATLDVVQYPSRTFQGVLTMPGGTPRKLLGILEGETLALYGPGAKGSLTRSGGKLTVDGQDFSLSRTAVGKTNAAVRPEGAHMLFDGKNLDAFPEAKWKILPDGAVESVPRSGSLKTKDKYGDVRLYLEFREPFNPECVRQRRGNSGIILMGSYEVQVLDSFGLDPQANDCGAIYSISPPRTNASAPPLEWQSYLIEFHAPRFAADGKKLQNARLSVWQNGILIQDQVEAPRLTGASHDPGKPSRPEPNGPAALVIQDHGNTLQYRNIWIEPLSK